MLVSRRTLLAMVPVAFMVGTSSVALAKTMSFNVPLSGAQQVPPVHSPGSGTAHLTYNSATRHVSWTIHYSKLSSPVTMAHFHKAPEGKSGPVVLWLTKKGASVSSPITGHATLTPAEAKEFMAGDLYINVHTKDHPAGEIRGQVMPPK